MILHCYHSRQGDLSSKIVLRSPSRDTDILVLATAILDSNRAHRDYGKGKLRKGFWPNQVVIEDQLKKKRSLDLIHSPRMPIFVLFQERQDVLEGFYKNPEFCLSVLSTGRKLYCRR